MRLEDVTAVIRPRSDWEAVDLGFTMARRSFWRCLLVWWLALLGPLAIAVILLWEHPWWVMILAWWWKPAAARMVLFELSRRLFGEVPAWRQIWPEIPKAWWRRFGLRFLWGRFSLQAPVTMAVEDLEGLRGSAYRLRCRMVLRRGDGAVMWLTIVGEMISAWVTVGVVMLMTILLPQGQSDVLRQLGEVVKEGDPSLMSPGVVWMIVICSLVAQSVCGVFVAGGGFGIYVNNRTWIEGWDVELAFKRLANRLGKIAVIVFAAMFLAVAERSAAADAAPAEMIREVKASPDFVVHKQRVPEPSPTRSSSTPPRHLPGWWAGFAQAFGTGLLVVCGTLVLGFIAWLLWQFRHVFKGRGGSGDKAARPVARVVMGMEVSRESLPEDIPTTALRWWREGRRQEALALLYRGAISRAIELARVEIAESDTEGDCLRRVREAGAAAHPGYFQGLTGSWIGLAYARTFPGDGEVENLCRTWPYVERSVGK